MFYGCSNLTELDLSGWDTSKVFDSYMMFFNCGELVTLDLSNFDVSQVSLITQVFAKCSKLETIYANDWTTTATKVFLAQDLFWQCSSLKGAVEFNPAQLGLSMANPTNGYFSVKAITE